MRIFDNNFFKNKPALAVFLALLLIAPSLAFADFNAEKIIEDRQFNDIQTFGSAAGIQKFLESKRSVLANTTPLFLQKLKEPLESKIKLGLDDPEPGLGRLRSAAELIWDASRKALINPQIILVILQKEQSLITGDFGDNNKLQRALDTALGFGCPDSGGCQAIFRGFYFQLFGNFDTEGNRYVGAPGSLIRSFNTPGGRGPAVDAQNQTFGLPVTRNAKINDRIVLSNTQGPPYNAAATQTVLLQNAATAALYRYTPHVYNGNFNFWKFFNAWFKYANGTLIRLGSDSKTYIISDGLKSLIPNFVIISRGLNPNGAIVVSPTEFSDYDTGAIYGPADFVLVRVDVDVSRKVFAFLDGVRRPVSDFVLSQRGLKSSDAILISQVEADLFTPGELLPPEEQTLIQPKGSKTVYVITSGKKMALSAFAFKQYQYSAKNINILPGDEVEAYASGGFLLPKNGTLIRVKDTPGTFILQNNLLRPVSDTVFKLYKYKQSQINTFAAGELDNAGLGGFLPPPEGTYFKDSSGNYFYLKNGTRHWISPFVFKQRAVARLAVQLSDQEVVILDEGTPLPPKDGTLIKGDKSQAIYAIVKGQKTFLDYAAWMRQYKKQKPNILPEAELASYPNAGDEQQ